MPVPARAEHLSVESRPSRGRSSSSEPLVQSVYTLGCDFPLIAEREMPSQMASPLELAMYAGNGFFAS